MDEHVLNDDERIAQCHARIIDTLNEYKLPLTVSALILENVQMRVQLEMKNGGQSGR